MMENRKIKVLHVNYSLEMGGAERVIVNYAKFTDRDKYHICVCAITGDGHYSEELKEFGVKCFNLNKKRGLRSISIILKLLRIMREENFDVVHFHDLSSSLWGVIPARLSPAKALIRTFHTVETNKKDIVLRIKSLFEFVILYLFFDQLITVSDEVKRSHIRNNNLLSSKYITIYNGLDESIFGIDFDRRKYLTDLNITDKPIFVGTIGRFFPAKAHEVFLEAMNLVLNRRSDVGVLIVGDGPKRKELIELSTELGISDRVVFTGMRKDVPHLLKLIDIFVLSSDQEGFPMTILEAMACGKPVVVTDVGGNREAVSDGETGFIVPPRNPLALSEAIIKLIDSTELGERMGMQGRERVLKKFTASEMVKKTEAVYEQFV